MVNEQYPNMIWSIPKVKGDQLEHFYWDSSTELLANRWGILEPIGEPNSEVDTINMVIIPLLVADVFGHRVGYGKGYYDRFLSQLNNDVIKVGLSFFDPIETVHPDPWDIPLNTLVTPNNIWEFSS